MTDEKCFLYPGDPSRPSRSSLRLFALNAGATSSYNPQCSNQRQQQGPSNYHDEQQLCGTQRQCVQEVRPE